MQLFIKFLILKIQIQKLIGFQILETNIVIIKSVHVEFIKNKFISDSNVQEPDLKVMTLNSTISEKYKNPEVIGLNEPKKSQRVRKEKHKYIFYFY